MRLLAIVLLLASAANAQDVGGKPAIGGKVAFTGAAFKANPSVAYLQDVVNDGCTASSTTCTVALAYANKAGSTIMVDVGSKGWTGSPPKIASVWMCNTNPCTSNTEGSTWKTGLTGSPWTIAGGSPTHGVDIAYDLSTNGGATFMTVTRTAGTVTFWGITPAEALCSNCGTISLDAIGTASGSNSCTSCSGSSFSSLSGTNDFILQPLEIDNLASAVSSPYIETGSTQWLYALETNATAAPTFTQTPAGQILIVGLAFKTTTAPTSPVWNYAQNVSNFGCAGSTTTCNVTTAATTSGSALYCATFTVDATQRVLSSCSMNSGGGSFSACGAPCQSQQSGNWQDEGIILGGNGGGTSLTCTLSTTETAANWGCEVLELKCVKNCGTLAQDQVGTATASASCTACLGPSYSGLTGVSDSTGGPIGFANNATGLPTTPFFIDTTNQTWLYELNTINTVAPTVTQTPAGGAFIPGVAVK